MPKEPAPLHAVLPYVHRPELLLLPDRNTSVHPRRLSARTSTWLPPDPTGARRPRTAVHPCWRLAGAGGIGVMIVASYDGEEWVAPVFLRHLDACGTIVGELRIMRCKCSHIRIQFKYYTLLGKLFITPST
ncbi:hypothetical protein GGX14DRAFT_406457 [Mycena pura]|uniref:Uncharacterized protein n=1 Tax=Mycena pura TaxID=153505 RepID=A0AAD6UQC5_9AGAR|nr:hypothetical protein GGX14DRAFT_406457 [Mycena pura]